MIYGHGDDAYQYNISFRANFSSNVWYERTAAALITHLNTQLISIANYPNPNADELGVRIAEHHQLTSDQVCVTNGATEAFYIIAAMYANQKVAIGIPTFSEYEDACRTYKMECRYYSRSELEQTHFEEALVFICNPNNPDGISTPVSVIEKLLVDFPNTMFVIDEAYIEFTDQIDSCVSLLETYTNLIIVRSLTKLFSIPGLRLGYILCHETIRQQLQQFKMPWSVNAMAIEAGNYIYDHYNDICPDMNSLLSFSKILQQQIDMIQGFTVLPSTTNYFLVKLDAPVAAALKDYLAHTHQLLIRDASNFRGLDNHYIRIASQSPKHNEWLVKALEQWSIR